MMPGAIYAIEHLDRFCDIRFISLDQETIFLETLHRQGSFWAQRLCVLDPVEHSSRLCDEEYLLAHYCTRRLIPMQNERSSMPRHYLAFDHVQDLLNNAHPEWDRFPAQPPQCNTLMRFARGSDPELVVRPHDRGWAPTGPRRNNALAPVYIQETSMPPACTLSLDEDDLRYAEGDWREYLGEVEVNLTMEGFLEVRFDEIVQRIQRSSIQMIRMSNCMPPTYLPREWLEREFEKEKIVH